MRNARSLATVLLLPLLLQCHDKNPTAPDLSDNIRAIAIRVHVDLASGTVATVQTPPNSAVSLSLLGSDAVGIQSSNMTATPSGANKTLVRFDVAITNSLANVNLVKSTVPAPPAGVTGIVLFPFEATAAGGSTGKVTASTDWDGAPYSFFNDVNCTGARTSDCFRWEEFAPLAAGATSAARSVGFEIDNSVAAFDVVMLLAADLQNVPEAPPAISLSSTTAAFSYAELVPATILVKNSGGGTLSGLTATVTYPGNQTPWTLEARLSSTTAPSVLTLTVFPVLATDGTYTATVAVASPGVSNSPQTVSVTFVVSGSAIANAIYVSQSDPTAIDDLACGLGPSNPLPSSPHPCRTIAFGFARASATGRPEVRVADGRYNEGVSLVNGKNLLGGYQPDNWQRHLNTTNTIIDGVTSTGNHDRTVFANGITNPTLFEGFVVRGSANAKTGGNSYAIYVANSGNLTIRGNQIFGGVGGPGVQGAAGQPGAQFTPDGIGRDSDPAAYDALITTGTGQCAVTNNRFYINGGQAPVGAGTFGGGNGGGTFCPTSSELMPMSAQPGSGGLPASGGGFGGSRGFDFRLELDGTVCIAATGSQVGGDGGPGANGQSGPGANGALSGDGSVVGGHWVGASGAAGVGGFNGGGGGGGGAGGGAYSLSTPEGKDRLGGVGGGGGAGGAAGGGGAPGSAGGGAFGIFIVGTAPVISGNTVVRGNGGSGGAGGAGAFGAIGGHGGAGGVGSLPCTGSGGNGGKGGKGGDGSGGGGGAGGASFGIYTSGAGTPDYCSNNNNTISGGFAGLGGPGGASPGLAAASGAGAAGALATCAFK